MRRGTGAILIGTVAVVLLLGTAASPTEPPRNSGVTVMMPADVPPTPTPTP
jgi:hypothetical protein